MACATPVSTSGPSEPDVSAVLSTPSPPRYSPWLKRSLRKPSRVDLDKESSITPGEVQARDFTTLAEARENKSENNKRNDKTDEEEGFDENEDTARDDACESHLGSHHADALGEATVEGSSVVERSASIGQDIEVHVVAVEDDSDVIYSTSEAFTERPISNGPQCIAEPEFLIHYSAPGTEYRLIARRMRVDDEDVRRILLKRLLERETATRHVISP
ncbi:uncharacterized protein BXZ73DRAFT_76495 [Epithele typhae]|uniref:uncharacterized protein n=1 Tax=Epithele typhae TaxID=378194 RepID=UPI0020078349|nr:uncharacterized protein BXZ73DRAFT_76495 [Epithele typhae]KAH9937868.1 hypothetical protein BXZ73DRAFT_76495 [Epithele typhae]